MSIVQEAYETWAKGRLLHSGSTMPLYEVWLAAYTQGECGALERAAKKCESMANFTGYYAGYCNDPLNNAADAIRDLPQST